MDKAVACLTMQMRYCDRGETLSPKTGLAEQHTLQTSNGVSKSKRLSESKGVEKSGMKEERVRGNPMDKTEEKA
jgi:hypothetical protein